MMDTLELQRKATLTRLLKAEVDVIAKLDDLIRTYGYENEPWFLDWQDAINQIVTK